MPLEGTAVLGDKAFGAKAIRVHRKYRTNAYLRDNMPYDTQTDTYICPAGKQFVPIHETKRKSTTGHVILDQIVHVSDAFGHIVNMVNDLGNQLALKRSGYAINGKHNLIQFRTHIAAN